MAVAAAGSGGSGSFKWQQSGVKTLLEMQGPVGIGGLQLILDGDRAQLTASDGRQLESAAAWAELEARLGAPVPAQNLRYWLLGIPAPGAFRWLSRESPETLEQDGWQIVYERFTLQSGNQLPARLTATNGASRVRLVIDRWVLGPEQP
jgi:outer membrane lipoprotein LolB